MEINRVWAICKQAQQDQRERKIRYAVLSGVHALLHEESGKLYGGQEDIEEATKAKHWECAGNNEKNAARPCRVSGDEN